MSKIETAKLVYRFKFKSFFWRLTLVYLNGIKSNYTSLHIFIVKCTQKKR